MPADRGAAFRAEQEGHFFLREMDTLATGADVVWQFRHGHWFLKQTRKVVGKAEVWYNGGNGIQ